VQPLQCGFVAEWNIKGVASDQFVSVIAILELETGVLRMERRDPAQAAVLRGWMDKAVFAGVLGASSSGGFGSCAALRRTAFPPSAAGAGCAHRGDGAGA
jgi:hypothetical protein